jgi:hypothetical protein
VQPSDKHAYRKVVKRYNEARADAGPRTRLLAFCSVRTYALWTGDENRILFYDGQGERFAETTLSEAPDPSMQNGAPHLRKMAA